VLQEYEPPTLPSGFVFKFVLMSTWDDRFYIGLDGLELYDQFDRLVQVPSPPQSARPTPSFVSTPETSGLQASSPRARATPSMRLDSVSDPVPICVSLKLSLSVALLRRCRCRRRGACKQIKEDNLHVFCAGGGSSVADLAECPNDPRTPEKVHIPLPPLT